MTSKLCSIIIINYQSDELVLKQLDELNSARELEIIIVNNSFTNHSNNFKDISDVKLIQNNFNQGFSFAANQGTAQAKGEWLLFLNPDVTLTPAQITEFITMTRKQELDAASPQFDDPNYSKPIPSLVNLLKEFSPLKFLLPNTKNQMTLVGGCLLIKSSVLHNLGGWDERFFLWFEDSDLSQRLLNENYKFNRLPVKIDHIGGESFKTKSSSWKTRVFFHSLAIYSDKHFSKFENWLIKLFILNRYIKNHLLPILNDVKISITIPNMKFDLLVEFLIKNIDYLKMIQQPIVVSSSLNISNLWKLRKQYPHIRFIPLKHNSGFAKTVNTGFKVSLGSWIGTCNDDTVFTENIWPELMKLADNNTGSLGPTILTKDKSIESMGILVEKKGKAKVIKDSSTKDRVVVDANNGAAVLYNSSVLDQIGLFDEVFGSYLEDIDLSLRIKSHGWENLVIPSLSIIHHGQSSSITLGKYKRWLDFKNWTLLVLKNWSILEIIIFLPHIILERARNFYAIWKN